VQHVTPTRISGTAGTPRPLRTADFRKDHHFATEQSLGYVPHPLDRKRDVPSAALGVFPLPLVQCVRWPNGHMDRAFPHRLPVARDEWRR
ncbi:MAG: hypothetical protein L0Z50_14565, partial [Verrucomicrobiales bacterium]|nr:hypothetical protein [Verrucomicrobiales bacterium]